MSVLRYPWRQANASSFEKIMFFGLHGKDLGEPACFTTYHLIRTQHHVLTPVAIPPSVWRKWGEMGRNGKGWLVISPDDVREEVGEMTLSFYSYGHSSFGANDNQVCLLWLGVGHSPPKSVEWAQYLPTVVLPSFTVKNSSSLSLSDGREVVVAEGKMSFPCAK